MAKISFDTIQYLILDELDGAGWYYVPADMDPDDFENTTGISSYDSAISAHRQAYLVLNDAIPAEDEGIQNTGDLGEDLFIATPEAGEADNHRFLITSRFNINNFKFLALDDVDGTAPSFGPGLIAFAANVKILSLNTVNIRGNIYSAIFRIENDDGDQIQITVDDANADYLYKIGDATPVDLLSVDISPSGSDRPPVFAAEDYEFEVAENADGSSTAIAVGTVSASDADGDTINYALVRASDGSQDDFAINATTGAITYTGSGLDYEALVGSNGAPGSINLTVRATANGKSDTQIVKIFVTNVEEAPIISLVNAATSTIIPLTNTGGDTIDAFAFSVSDPDENVVFSAASFTITEGNAISTAFEVVATDAGHYTIALKSGVTLTAGSHTLAVTAKDGSGAGALTSDPVTFNVSVIDPIITITSAATSSVDENDNLYSHEITAQTAGSYVDSYSFSLKEEGDYTAFTIVGNELRFASGQTPDYETKTSYSLTLVATSNNTGRTAEQTFSLSVNDLNDEPPVFDHNDTTGAVNEGASFEKSFSATPDVAGTNVEYYIDNTDFEIDENGLVTSKSTTIFDADGPFTSYVFTVTATTRNADNEQLSATRIFTLTVTDIVDEAPNFGNQPSLVQLPENETFDRTFTATPDVSETLTYSLSGADAASFAIDSATGRITSIAAIYDADTEPSNPGAPAATLGTRPASSDDITFDDGAGTSTFAFRENTDFSSIVVNATTSLLADPDAQNPVAAAISYSISDGDSALFTINEVTGEITAAGNATLSFDYEEKTAYNFYVTATVGNVSSTQLVQINVINEVDVLHTYDLTVTATSNVGSDSHSFTIEVTDANDTPPVFVDLTTTGSVEEGKRFARSFVAIPDVAGDVVAYAVSGTDASFFSIDANGNLTSNSDVVFDADGAKTSYNFTVTATTGTGANAQSASLDFTLSISDIYDEGPTFIHNDTAQDIYENTFFSKAFGAVADVADGVTISYRIEGTHADLFELFYDSDGDVFVISKDPNGFDADVTQTPPSYNFTVIATSSDGDPDNPVEYSTSRQFTVNVLDLNDLDPVFGDVNTTPVIANDSGFDMTYSATPDVAGDTVRYSLSGVDAARFSIDAATGRVTSKADFVTSLPPAEVPATTSLPANPFITFPVGAVAHISTAENGALPATSYFATGTFDTALYDPITYSLTGPDAAHFTIDPVLGVLSLAAGVTLDYETQPNYAFNVIATATAKADSGIAAGDAAYMIATGHAVTLTVTNVAESIEFASDTPRSISVTENEPFEGIDFSASTTGSSAITYRLEGADASAFAISQSGRLSAASNTTFDFEEKESYDLVVVAQDGASTARWALRVDVQDVADTKSTYNFTVTATTGTIGSTDERSADVDITVTIFAFSHSDTTQDFNEEQIYTRSFAATTNDARYTLTGADASFFSINESTGVVTANAAVDADAASAKLTYNFTVQATRLEDGTTQSISRDFTLNISDINDEAPVFTDLTTSQTITENVTFSRTFNATPDVAGDKVTYSLSGADRAKFHINSDTGLVTSIEPFDYEAADAGDNRYDFTVTAAVGTEEASLNFTVIITDVTIEALAFSDTTAALTIDENVAFARQFTATPVEVTDVITYEISGTDAGLFSINAATGAVTAPAFDADAASAKPSYQFTVTAKSNAGTASEEEVSLDFTLTVRDVADEAPIFDNTTTTQTIDENLAFSRTFTATPDVAGDTVLYALSGTDAASFTINATTGEVTASAFDSEAVGAKDTYHFTVTASTGSGATRLARDLDFQLTINDVADNAPIFNDITSTASIAENLAFSRTFTATPDVPGDSVFYELSGADASRFAIDSATGEVTAPAFDYEAADGKRSFDFIVTASTGTGASRLSTDLAFSLNVTDVEEQILEFDDTTDRASITENNSFERVFTATPRLAGDTITYSLSGTDAALFNINAATGRLTTKEKFDADSADAKDVYQFTVTAATGAGANYESVTLDFALTVTDIHDEGPVFDDPSTNISHYEASHFSRSFSATPDLASLTVAYHLEGADKELFLIDAVTGLVTSRAGVRFDGPDAKPSYQFTVIASTTDADDKTFSSYNYFTVNVRNTLGVDDHVKIIDQGKSSISLVADDFTALSGTSGTITYTLTTLPQGVTLVLNGTSLAIGGEFTNQDVANGLLSLTITNPATITNFSLTTAVRNADGSAYEDYILYVDVREDFSTADNTGRDTLDASAETEAVVISGGNQRDKITDGVSDDYIEGGLGRDVIALTSGGADTVYYRFSYDQNANELIAYDGQDRVTGFTIGEDSLVLRQVSGPLGASDNTASLLSALTTAGLRARITTSTVNNELYAKGITFVFTTSGQTATGSSAGRDLRIEFSDAILYSTFLTMLDGTVSTRLHYVDDLTKLQNIFGDKITLEDAQISGTAGNDEIYGTPVSDIINKTGAGNDVIYGLGGDDVIHATSGIDTIDGGSGFDRVSFEDSAQRVNIDLADPTRHRGDAANDRYTDIEGFIGSDHNDIFTGDDGNNHFDGGAGNDSLTGGAGDDRLHGGDGADIIYGNTGEDTLYGGDGADVLSGGADADTLYGGAGADIIYGDAGSDRLYGGDGADDIEGGAGDDRLYGGAGADEIDGGLGDDRVYGGAGDDHITISSADNDAIDGGSGTDTLHLQGVTAEVDLLDGTVTHYVGTEGARLAEATSTIKNVENVIGSANDDIITGDRGTNVIEGGAGADTLDGGLNNDTLSYASSSEGVKVSLARYADTEIDAQGYVILGADAGGDAVGDRIKGFEGLLGSAHDDELEGNGYAQIITGGAGNDTIRGLGGSDVLFGGDGNDIIDGGSGENFIYGGAGDDSFALVLESGSHQTIVDFAMGRNVIALTSDDTSLTATSFSTLIELYDAFGLYVEQTPAFSPLQITQFKRLSNNEVVMQLLNYNAPFDLGDFTVNGIRLAGNRPVFADSVPHAVSQSENTAFSQSFAAIAPLAGTITYQLEGDSADLFTISSNGLVTLQTGKSIDFEAAPEHQLTIVATTAGFAARHDVTITVVDVADGPSFSSATALTIEENDSSLSHQLTATNAAGNGAITFALAADYDGPLTINSQNQLVFQANYPGFDAESESTTHRVTVIASDNEGSTAVEHIITITDINEGPPIFSAGLENEFSVVEHTTNFDQTFTANADVGSVVYSLSGDTANFNINTATGRVWAKSSANFDYDYKFPRDSSFVYQEGPDGEPVRIDATTSYNLTITATAGGLQATHDFTVNITDSDDGPMLNFNPLENTLNENELGAFNPNNLTGFLIPFAGRADNGQLGNGNISFLIDTDRYEGTSLVNHNSARIFGWRIVGADDFEGFDYEALYNPETGTATYDVPIVGVGLIGNEYGIVRITVVNQNDERPEITSGRYGISLIENEVIDDTLVLYTATGTYDAEAITWSLKANNEDDAALFTIDEDTGIVTFANNQTTVARADDKNSYHFTIVATSGTLESVERAVTIGIRDDANASDTLTVTALTSAIAEGDNVGVIDVAQITVTGSGYSLSIDQTDRFELVNGILRTKADADFDHESQTIIPVTITASKAGADDIVHLFTLSLTDVNDVSPVITSTVNIIGDVTEEVEIPTSRVFYRATGTYDVTPIIWSLKPDNDDDADLFKIDPLTGEVTLIAPTTFDRESNSERNSINFYSFTVVATSGDTIPDEKQVAFLPRDDRTESGPELRFFTYTNAIAEGDDVGVIDIARFFVVNGTGYSLTINQTDRFEIVNGTLRTKAGADFDYETETYVPVTVEARKAGATDIVRVHNVIITNDLADDLVSTDSLTLSATSGAIDEADNVAVTDLADVTIVGSNYHITITGDDRFEVVSGKLRIKAGSDFDYETEESVTITVQASKPDAAILSQTFTLTINNVGPTFTSADTLTVNEGANILHLLTASAVGTPATYALGAGYQGPLTLSSLGFLQGVLDHEVHGATHIVPITASSDGESTTQMITITVTDVNDTPPIFDAGATSLSHVEDATFAPETYHAVPDVAGDTVTYSLSGDDASAFRIDSSTGVLSVATTTTFNAATKSSYSFDVVATVGTQSASRSVIVTITEGTASNFITLPTSANEGVTYYSSDDADRMEGTDKQDILYGDGGDDIINANNDALHIGGDIIIGGYGRDIINLTSEAGGGGVDQIIYRFDSSDASAWQATDGADIIHNFHLTVDKFLFVDVATNSTIRTLNDFMTGFFAGGGRAAFTQNDAGYINGLTFTFGATGTSDGTSAGTDTGDTVTLRFRDLLTNDEAAQVRAALGGTLSVTSTNAPAFQNVIAAMLNDEDGNPTLSVTTDNTPSGLSLEEPIAFTSGAMSLRLAVTQNTDGSVETIAADDFAPVTYSASATSGAAVSYRVISTDSSGNDAASFEIGAASGVLTIKTDSALDYAQQQSYDLTILATDADGNIAARTVSIILTGPPLFTSGTLALTADERIEYSADTPFYTARAETYDGAVTFSLKANSSDDSDLFKIDPNTNQVSFKVATTPDYETKSAYIFTVVATGSAGTVEQTVTLMVNDKDDDLFLRTTDGAIIKHDGIGLITENEDPETSSDSQDIDTDGDGTNDDKGLYLGELGAPYSAHGFTLASGAGDNDDFVILDGNKLYYTGPALDFEADPSDAKTIFVTESTRHEAAATITVPSGHFIYQGDGRGAPDDTVFVVTDKAIPRNSVNDISDVTITIYYEGFAGKTISGVNFHKPNGAIRNYFIGLKRSDGELEVITHGPFSSFPNVDAYAYIVDLGHISSSLLQLTHLTPHVGEATYDDGSGPTYLPDGEIHEFKINIIDVDETVTNTPPTGADASLSVARTINYDFTATDFSTGFADADSDTFNGITIVTLPGANDGVLKIGETAVTAGQALSLTDIDNLIYEVPGFGAERAAFTASFTYRVTDDEGAESISAYTMTLNVPSFAIQTPAAAELNEGNTITGTAEAELLQTGGHDDVITSGGGGDIIIGGYGDDTITLGAGSDTVIYRFDSSETDNPATTTNEGNWKAIDGGDVINGFARGTDKLLLVDTNSNGITSLDEFYAGIAVSRDNPDASWALPNNIVGIQMLSEVDDYTGLSIEFRSQSGRQSLSDSVQSISTLTINFAEAIIYETPLSDAIDALRDSFDNEFDPSVYRQLLELLFTDSDTGVSDFDVTNDTTPFGITIL